MMVAARIKPIDPSRVVAVIPARHGSLRFPAKALALLAGRPLIAHVVSAALRAARIGRVIVATDHEEILRAALAAGAEAEMTRSDHSTGSDRIGELLPRLGEAEIILNLQGDEPLLPPSAADRLVALLEAHPEAGASTLASPLEFESPEFADPNVVKVVRATDGRALYFSRASIPGQHPRGDALGGGLRHVGLYGYRRPTLEAFLAAPPSRLEQQEGLEQLRLLELGETMVVGVVPELPPGVDTPEDLERCAAILAANGPA